MHDIDAIEMINVEQLATQTDRLLLRGRHTKRRLSTNKIVYRPMFRVELAHERLHVEPPPPRAPDPEHTLFVRARRFSTSTTSAAILATAFAIAIVIVGHA